MINKLFTKTVIVSCFLFVLNPLVGQDGIRDRAVIVKAITQEQPPQIILEWESPSFAVNTQIYRKRTTDPHFPTTPIAQIAAPGNRYTDEDIVQGVLYDYTLVQSTQFTQGNQFTTFAWGGITTGVNIEVPGFMGKILIVVDSEIESALQTGYERFKNDLILDGWTVYSVTAQAQDGVPQIKNKIRDWYNQHEDYAAAVLLLGNIPVPYSGNFSSTQPPPDMHIPDHNGAWAADVYYGIMNENLFTDVANNVDGISREANKNRPGDGKFDQSTIPTGSVQLQVGRIDMSDLNAISGTYLEKTERYFHKNHAYRYRLFAAPERSVYTDRLNLLGGEAPGRVHYFNSSLLGIDSILGTSQYFPTVKSQASLFSGVTSTAGYRQINNVGHVDNFNDSVYSVFNHYFGSYFADWDIDNNFLRGVIAGPGYTLTSIWSGRPVVHFHAMGMGKNIGYCLKHAQSNQLSQFNMGFYPGAFGQSIHISMHGDPTLRLHTVSAPSELVVSPQNQNTQVLLSWNPSPDSQIEGYHIYRAVTPEGPYQKITTAPVTQSLYTDENPWLGDNYYLVRAVKKQHSVSGTYLNLSQGVQGLAQQIDGDPNIGIEHIEGKKPEIVVYPNPGRGSCNVDMPADWIGAKITVRDLHGKICYQAQAESAQHSIQFRDIKAGVYVIECAYKQQVVTQKWIQL